MRTFLDFAKKYIVGYEDITDVSTLPKDVQQEYIRWKEDESYIPFQGFNTRSFKDGLYYYGAAERLIDPTLKPDMTLDSKGDILSGYTPSGEVNPYSYQLPSRYATLSVPNVVDASNDDLSALEKVKDTRVAPSIGESGIAKGGRYSNDWRGMFDPFSRGDMRTEFALAGRDFAAAGDMKGLGKGLTIASGIGHGITGIMDAALAGAEGYGAYNIERQMRAESERRRRERMNQGRYFAEGGMSDMPSQELYMNVNDGLFGPRSMTEEYAYALPNSMRDYANTEIEGGEYVLAPGRNVREAYGDKHEDGGMDIDAAPNTRILSDELSPSMKAVKSVRELFGIVPVKGNTYATLMDKYKTHIGLKDLYQKMEGLYKRLEKNEKITDENTRMINSSMIGKGINEVQKEIDGKSADMTAFFNYLYKLQEEDKDDKYNDYLFGEGGIVKPSLLMEMSKKYGITEDEGKKIILEDAKNKRLVYKAAWGGTVPELKTALSKLDKKSLRKAVAGLYGFNTGVSDGGFDVVGFGDDGSVQVSVVGKDGMPVIIDTSHLSNPEYIEKSLQQVSGESFNKIKQYSADSNKKLKRLWGIYGEKGVDGIVEQFKPRTPLEIPRSTTIPEEHVEEVIHKEEKQARDNRDYHSVLQMPYYYRQTPSAPVFNSLKGYEPEEIKPVLVDPSREIGEIQRTADMQKRGMEVLADSQKMSMTAAINAATTSAVSRAVRTAEEANRMALQQADNYNVQTRNQAKLQNNAMREQYENSVMQTLTNQDLAWGQYFNSVNQEVAQKANARTSMNMFESMFPDMRMGADGRIHYVSGGEDIVSIDQNMYKLNQLRAAQASLQEEIAGMRKK